MKRYMVNITFTNGQRFDFETNTDVRKLKPIEVNGAKMLFTKEQIGINILHVKEMVVVKL